MRVGKYKTARSSSFVVWFYSMLERQSTSLMQDFFFTITVKSSFSLNSHLFSFHTAKSVLLYSSATMLLSVFQNYCDHAVYLTRNQFSFCCNTHLCLPTDSCTCSLVSFFSILDSLWNLPPLQPSTICTADFLWCFFQYKIDISCPPPSFSLLQAEFYLLLLCFTKGQHMVEKTVLLESADCWCPL